MPDIDPVVADEPILAAWGNDVADEINLLRAANDHASVRVHRQTNGSQATTNVGVNWDGEKSDPQGFHSLVSNTSRLVVPSGLGGLYLVVAHIVNIVSAGGSNGVLSLFKNTSATGDQTPSIAMAVGAQFHLTATVELAVADYVEVRLVHNAGDGIFFALAESYMQAIRLGS